jgi:hypothetical protein
MKIIKTKLPINLFIFILLMPYIQIVILLTLSLVKHFINSLQH